MSVTSMAAVQVKGAHIQPVRMLPCRVGIKLSQVEVRFEDLNIETDVFVGSRALPSVTNEFLNYAQASARQEWLFRTIDGAN